jgi:glycosyltransferase involved in cell wall biosynthesis
MKFRFLISGDLPDDCCGITEYVYGLADTMGAAGADLKIWSLGLRAKRGLPALEANCHTAIDTLPFRFADRPAALRATRFFPELFDVAASWMVEDRPDVLHVFGLGFNLPVVLAALQYRVPVVFSHLELPVPTDPRAILADRPGNHRLHDPAVWTEAAERAAESFVDRAWRTAARRAAFHHCATETILRAVTEADAPAENTAVWAPGALDELAPSVLGPEPGDGLRLAYVGYLGGGLELVLDALDALPAKAPVELHLFLDNHTPAGEPRDAALATRLATMANVTTRRRLPPDEFADVYRQIDALVVGRATDACALFAATNALAVGTPVIAPATDDIEAFAALTKNTITHAPGDAAALADVIRRLAKDPDLLAELAAAAAGGRAISEDAVLFAEIYAVAQAGPPPPEVAFLVDEVRLAEQTAATAALRPRVAATLERLHTEGIRHIALYGAGRHTLRVLADWPHTEVEVVAILDDSPDACGGKILRIPVRPPREATELGVEAVVVSSDRWQAEILAKATPLREAGLLVLGFYAEDAK